MGGRRRLRDTAQSHPALETEGRADVGGDPDRRSWSRPASPTSPTSPIGRSTSCRAGSASARDGRIVAAGESGEVITEELLAEVFGLGARVIEDPVAGTPLVVPVGSHHRSS
jgi:hypothetical protein